MGIRSRVPIGFKQDGCEIKVKRLLKYNFSTFLELFSKIKVELLHRDFVILVGTGSGCDTILNLEFFPPKFELIYYCKHIVYICHCFSIFLTVQWLSILTFTCSSWVQFPQDPFIFFLYIKRHLSRKNSKLYHSLSLSLAYQND